LFASVRADITFTLSERESWQRQKKRQGDRLSTRLNGPITNGFHGDRVYRGWPVFRLAFFF